jgi:hypothetical protein
MLAEVTWIDLRNILFDNNVYGYNSRKTVGFAAARRLMSIILCHFFCDEIIKDQRQPAENKHQ